MGVCVCFLCLHVARQSGTALPPIRMTDRARTLLKRDTVQVELRGASLGAMKACVGQLLHEVQERLTFRAQIMIRDEIQAYTPSNEDLDYPNKLIALAHGAPSRPHSAAGLGGAVGGGEIWLVVLPRTLACLSQIFRTVDKKIFEGLAQDSVLACTQALLTATALIEKKQVSVRGRQGLSGSGEAAY